ncbi:hypothetical protein [Streptomyces barkulensis]|uniref:hypothetical protein n=1 Tax=Streptomyces barkulensis TaxID=1257026 RepID=UPI001F0E564A|nr:hypothetical protein [Streptomyces barkulensis]
MSMWQIHQVRRAAVAVTAAALTFTLSACGGGDGEDKVADKPSAEQTTGSQDEGTGGSGEVADDSKVIVTLKGPEDIVLDINSVVRDAGGFVTVNGVLKNTGGKEFYETSLWTGPELDLKKGAGGGSMGGASLVDKAEKKRYYTLRDTENRPLATMGIPSVKANSELNVFMQFPAPPENTTHVDLQIPTFQPATVEITGG